VYIDITYIKGRHETFHPSIHLVIHPSKFLILEEEDGRGRAGRMATTTTTTVAERPILLWS
jgi:hypothetical protein